MYSCPRSATVAALQDSVVWVLERQVFRSGHSAYPSCCRSAFWPLAPFSQTRLCLDCTWLKNYARCVSPLVVQLKDTGCTPLLWNEPMQQHCLMVGHRQFMQEAKETEASQVELFLNSVPLLASLSREEKLLLVDALEEQTFPAGTCVVKQVQSPTCLE